MPTVLLSLILTYPPEMVFSRIEKRRSHHSHTSRTSRNLSSFPHAFEFPAAIRFGLAFHVIIIIIFATRADKICSAHQWRRRRADFSDFGDMVWQWGGVDEECLIESAIILAEINAEGCHRENLHWFSGCHDI